MVFHTYSYLSEVFLVLPSTRWVQTVCCLMKKHEEIQETNTY
jgi:hypothetical protein